MSQPDERTHGSGQERPPVTAMYRNRHRLGTTLVEVLVVIVVFLVGILAVIQIFPKGYQILLLTRGKSVSQALARDTMESLAARSDELPEQIVSVHYDSNGNMIVDSNRDPSDLGPVGATLAADGTMLDASGNPLGPWQLVSGSNAFRRIVGEGRRVPAPGAVGAPGSGSAYYGGLMVLQFGPINYQPATISRPSNLAVYGNDLEQLVGQPAPQDLRTEYQYFVVNGGTSTIQVLLPTGPLIRKYHVSFSAYVNTSTGVVKRDYAEIPVVSLDPTVPDVSGQYPLVGQTLTILANDSSIVSVDLNTLRVQRAFTKIDRASAFDTTDPYQYKLLNENLGVLLFNPIGHEVYISRNGNDRQPLQARVNYDVYDWRILHDDFRVDAGVTPGEPSIANPQLLSCQHKLPVDSLKVAGLAGADGLPNPPIAPLESVRTDGTTDTSAANGNGTDNFVLVDLQTGGVYCENNPQFTTQRLIHVDKSTGIVSIEDMDGLKANGITGALLLPDGNIVQVQMDNRAIRALYMARQEISVQVLKAAAQYSISSSPVNLSPGQFYIGGTVSGVGQPWRIYFPRSDNGRKVTIGEVTYRNSGSSYVQTLTGQDFMIKSRPDPTLSLPSVDLTDVDGFATAIDFTNGIGARSIKGASVAVRVLWNPDMFRLTNDPALNITKLEQWGRGWRKTTNETYMQRGENIK